ncbi:hypothetical protein HYFRA_00000671 [Hymenoscyphus fraxineus]|uniref:Uncharacterized protein n=1 Tax=Hymenoscyphus fraxineus TaxID=746836 RepID=A0A9N9L181_9HELO|nr:hypothetical protein HYFRA_00000671 [Hymenoscyphus fraxineus]
MAAWIMGSDAPWVLVWVQHPAIEARQTNCLSTGRVLEAVLVPVLLISIRSTWMEHPFSFLLSTLSYPENPPSKRGSFTLVLIYLYSTWSLTDCFKCHKQQPQAKTLHRLSLCQARLFTHSPTAFVYSSTVYPSTYSIHTAI